MMENEMVIIIGAGPAGLATAACLKKHSISSIIFERDDCFAPLWQKRTYDRLHLHLEKHLCSLPYMQHHPETPTYMPKDAFIDYLKEYASFFDIKPKLNHEVDSAFFDEVEKKWCIRAQDTINGDNQLYFSKFLVVATGENDERYIPDIVGLNNFEGEIIHANQYKSGDEYKDKEVLVIGSGNSGMEIAYDLSNFNHHASIVVRSPVHIMSKEIVSFGMVLLKYLPEWMVDQIAILLMKLKFGNLSKYGIRSPLQGPFHLKASTGRSPVIDTGTINKIKVGEIKVHPEILSIEKENVNFINGHKQKFDVLLFATGYKSSVNKWLKDYQFGFNDEGHTQNKFPNHWKGENGLYCAGFAAKGILGISKDAMAIAADIKSVIEGGQENFHGEFSGGVREGSTLLVGTSDEHVK